MIGGENCPIGQDDESLQGNEFLVRDEAFKRLGSGCEAPDNTGAAVGNKHGTVRGQREIAQDMFLAVVGQGDHPAQSSCAEVEFSEASHSRLLRSVTLHGGDGRGRSP